MNNYKLILQYDGSNYAGWQLQKNAVTIQQVVTDAIEIILKEKVVLTGSGRTDAGVHALGQAANFKTDSSLELYKFRYQLNSVLPFDISAVNAEMVDENFNSRYDARKRSYIYLLSRIKSPFYGKYSWNPHREIELSKLRTLSSGFLGMKDFSAFCKTSSETKNKVCEVFNISWTEKNNLIVFSIEADRFLHGMVRTILGTLLDSLKHENPEHFIEDIFENKDRTFAGESVPAKGLFLYKVEYDN